jgi:EAL domain-containing protein (putative c-di-GMP-specific phosphodiesterase class I)
MLFLSDLMLVLEPDAESRALLCALAARMGCEHVESESIEHLNEVLAVRRPTIAALAVDRVETVYFRLLDILSKHDVKPVMLLIGGVGSRVLAGARRAAESRGLSVVGAVCRPLDQIAIEKLLEPHLAVAPPVPREDLEQALAEHELTLVYQPKLAVSSAEINIQGLEALVRWQHPRRGLLQPRHFLHAVEEYGLMSQLTDFVLMDAIRQAGQWRSDGLQMEIIVNLSTKLVEDRDFPQRLATLLHENDFPPQQLTFDVTESLSVADRNLLVDVFTRLRILGVGLSLDNFGTGLSSLTELYRMPFSEIKVDHTLIADASREHEARVIVEAIVNLGHTLRLNVCAEGVETRQTLEFVRRVGFDTVQGRFFSAPVPASEVELLIRSWPSTGPAAAESWRPVEPIGFDSFAMTTRTLRARSVRTSRLHS